MIIQQVTVKRYNAVGGFLYQYHDEVAVKQDTDTPVYPDLQAQLKAERWNMQQPSDNKLDNRPSPFMSIYQIKHLTRRR